MEATTTPPLVKSLPVVGEFPLLAWNKLDHMVELRARRGDIFTLDLGFTKIVCLCHPSQAQHVLRDQVKNYSKGNALWDAIRGLLGNGLPTSEGNFWMRQRRMMQPHFHRESLTAMAELMVDAIDEQLALWETHAQSGRPFDLFVEMSRITMRVIVKTVFGSNLEQRQADLIANEMRHTLDYMLVSMATNRLPDWVPVPGRKRFNEAVANIDKIVLDVIAKRHQVSDRRGGAIIDMLMGAIDADTNERMTHQEMRDEAVSLFLAGYETTSAALSFAFRELNGHPRITREVVDEIDTVLGGRRPTIADARKLPRCLGVVQEALRLDSPSYWIPRTAVEDDVIDGYAISKGQEVAIITHVVHRHPDFWPEPERFDPNRFQPDAVQGRHPLAWIPFGAGQRLCIGKEFALMEGQFILARILAKYDVRPAYQETSTRHVGTSLRPGGGVWVRLTKRDENKSTEAARRLD